SSRDRFRVPRNSSRAPSTTSANSAAQEAGPWRSSVSERLLVSWKTLLRAFKAPSIAPAKRLSVPSTTRVRSPHVLPDWGGAGAGPAFSCSTPVVLIDIDLEIHSRYLKPAL